MFFDIFDPRKLPQSVTEISSYGNREITVWIDHYGKEKASTCKSVTINQVGDIDGVTAVEEWPGFRKYTFEEPKAEEEKFQMNLMNCKNKKDRCLRDLFWCTQVIFNIPNIQIQHDKVCAIIFPNCLKLLHLMLIFPLSTACVERFFSKMKLVKTRLRNQLSQVNLENLLFIAPEAPKTGFTDREYDFFVDELKKNNMRMDVWRTLY